MTTSKPLTTRYNTIIRNNKTEHTYESFLLETTNISNFKGISPVIKYRLFESGFSSLIDLVVRGPLDVMKAIRLKGIRAFKMAQKLCEDSRVELEEKGILNMNFQSAEEIGVVRKKLAHKILTGSINLDNLLYGGIETGAVTEIYGKRNVGILWLCYTLCVTVQQDFIKGGLKGNALFVDNRDKFDPAYPNTIDFVRYNPSSSLLKTYLL